MDRQTRIEAALCAYVRYSQQKIRDDEVAQYCAALQSERYAAERRIKELEGLLALASTALTIGPENDAYSPSAAQAVHSHGRN